MAGKVPYGREIGDWVMDVRPLRSLLQLPADRTGYEQGSRKPNGTVCHGIDHEIDRAPHIERPLENPARGSDGREARAGDSKPGIYARAAEQEKRRQNCRDYHQLHGFDSDIKGEYVGEARPAMQPQLT